MKIVLLSIGKIRSRPVREIVADYAGRIEHYLPFEIVACRDERQALSRIGSHDFLVLLDERGGQQSSEALARFLSGHQSRGTKRLAFFIGGPDGAGPEVKKRAQLTLSLSKMTLPHELAQALLAEQLYRACSINRGEPYHRGNDAVAK